MITSVAKIATEVLRQSAQHPSEPTEQIYQRAADQLGIPAELVAKAIGMQQATRKENAA